MAYEDHLKKLNDYKNKIEGKSTTVLTEESEYDKHVNKLNAYREQLNQTPAATQKAAEQAAYAAAAAAQQNSNNANKLTTVGKLISSTNAADQAEALRRFELELKSGALNNAAYTGNVYMPSTELSRLATGAAGTAKSMYYAPQLYAESYLKMAKDTNKSQQFGQAMGNWEAARQGIKLYDTEEAYKLMDPTTMALGALPSRPDLNAKESVKKAQEEMSKYGTVLTTENSKNMKKMQEAKELQQKALEGLDPASAWVGEQLMSVGQNLPSMALGLIPVVGPAVSLAVMGAIAAGDKVYEISSRGGSAGEAFIRGTVAGGIEAATEIVSLDNFLSIVKGTEKAPIKWVAKLIKNPSVQRAFSDILRQMGYEASEEVASYLANYVYDKSIADPDAKFKLTELLGAAAGGAFSALLLGGLGVGLNYTRTTVNTNNIQTKLMDNGETPANAKELAPIINKVLNQADISGSDAVKVAANKAAMNYINAKASKTNDIAARLRGISSIYNAATAEGSGYTGQSGTKWNQKQAAALAALTDEALDAIGQMEPGTPITPDEIGLTADSKEWQDLIAAGLVDESGSLSEVAATDEMDRRTLPQNTEEQNYTAAAEDQNNAAPAMPAMQTAADYQAALVNAGVDEQAAQEMAPVIEKIAKGVQLSEAETAVKDKIAGNDAAINVLYSILDQTTSQANIANNDNTGYDENAKAYNELIDDQAEMPERTVRKGSENPNAGLKENSNSRRFNRRTRRILDRLGKLIGVTIEIVDDLPSQNGRYLKETRTLQISMNTDNPLVTVLSHEVTHRLKETSPAEYDQLEKIALSQMRDNGKLANAIKTIKASYGNMITPELLREELTAHYARDLCNNVSEFEKLVGINRQLGQKILDIVDSIIHQLSLGSLGNERTTAAENEILGTAARTDYQLAEFREAWAAALNNATAYAEGINEKESKKIILGDTFPPYNESHSDANERASRWAHGKNVKSGDRKIVPYLGAWYIIEASDDAPLRYRILEKTNYVDNKRRISRNVTRKQSIRTSIDNADTINKRTDTYGHGRSSFNINNAEYRTENNGVHQLGEEQNGRRNIESSPDRNNEGSGENQQGDNAGLTDHIKFSMKLPVEETSNLIALHNLNADKLAKALDLGGFPMPSIAVTKTSIPHTNFGNITLVMDKNTIDPKADRRNTVYSADAWTPTFPSVEYEVNEQVAGKLRNKYYELYKQFGNEATRPLYAWANYADNELDRVGGEAALIEQEKDNVDMMKLFLMDQGKEVPATVTTENVERLDDNTVAFYDYFINAIGKEAFQELAAKPGENPLDIRKAWWAKYGDRFEEAYRGYMTSLGFTLEEINNVLENESVASQTRKALQMRNYINNGSEKKTTVTNIEATNKAIREAVNKAEYETWLHNLFDGIEKSSGIYNGRDRYTSSGNSRSFSATHYPVTLENIAKAMANENNGNSRNVSGFYGVKSLRAGMAKRFSNIAEMHQYENRLQHLTEEQATEINDALSKRLSSVMSDIYNKKSHSKYDNSFIEMDRIGNILMEITEQKIITVDSIKKAFSQYQYEIDNQLADNIRNLLFDISQMPVNIFEAKPERAVRFDEVRAAIIPQGTDGELIQKLIEAGVNVLEYKQGDTNDRLAKVNSVEDARFSRKLNIEGETENGRRTQDTGGNGRRAALADTGTIRPLQSTVGRNDSRRFTLWNGSKEGQGNTRIKDSEGQQINEADAQKLNGTAIVDNNSLPLATYHVTDTDFEQFENGDIGFHFGTKAQAEQRAANKGYTNPIFIRAYQNIQNPAMVSRDQYSWHALQAAWTLWREGIINDAEYDEITNIAGIKDGYDSPASVRLREIMESKGYDGIAYPNEFEKEGMSYIAFHDDQIIRAPLENNAENKNATNETSKGNTRESRKISPELLEKYGIQSDEAREISGNKRSTEYQNRARNRLVKSITEAFSMPSVLRDELSDIIATIDEEIATNGRPTATTISTLFREAWDKGLVAIKTYSDQYDALKKELRETRIKVSDTIKSDIADYGEFRKSSFGKLNLANEGNSVDTYYEELSERYPELFPTNIINPTDQLLKIAEVANSFRTIEVTLDKYADGNKELSGYIKNKFDKAVRKYTDDSLKAIKYEVERTALNEEADAKAALAERILNDQDKLKNSEKRMKELKREIERAKRKTLLSPRETKAVKALTEGLIDAAPEGPNAQAITELADLQREYNELKQLHDEHKHRAKAAYRRAAEILAANSDTWKDPKAGISLSTTTPERAMYRITGNRAEAQKLIESLILPIHSAEAERIRRINDITERIKALDLGTERKYEVDVGDKYGGIQNVSESGLVQLYGEGLITEKDLSRLKVDEARIKAAADTFREVYNELFEDLEATLLRNGYEIPEYRKNYFPHFDENENSGSILALAAKLTGTDISDAVLPTNLAGITEGFKPGKPYMRNLQERRGNKTTYDALEGLQKYMTAATNVIYHTDNIQRLRAFEDVLRYKYSDEGKQEMLDKLREKEDISQEEYDSRKAEITGRNIKQLPNFVTWLREYTNLLAGKKSTFDRNAEKEFSRGFYSFITALENRVAANMIAGNMSSSLTNFIPLFQVSSYEVSPKNMAKAMKMVITDQASTEALKIKSDFLTNRQGAESLTKKSKLERAAEIAGMPMELIDKFTSQTLTIGRYLQNIENAQKNGEAVDYDKAMQEADSWAASVMADRSKGAKPVIFDQKNPLTKIFTMFQVEVNNQLQHYFEDLPRELGGKDKAKWSKADIARFSTALTQKLLQTCFYGLAFKWLFGYDPTFNPFAIIYRFLKDIFADDKGLWDAATNAGEDLAQDLPFIGGVLGGGRVPIKSALPDWNDLKKALESKGKAVPQNLYEGLKPTLFTLLPPFGGNQARKTIEGVTTVAQGGSYTYDKEGNKKLKYPVAKTPLNYIRGTIAGKWAFPEAQEYIDSGFKSLSVKQTKELEALDALDKEANRLQNNLNNYSKYKDYLASIDADGNGSKTNKEKKNALNQTDFSYEKKAELYFSGSDSAYEKYKKALEKGIEAEAYYKLMTTADSDENGAIDRAERQKAVEALNLPKKETAELYFYSGSDKSYNNYQEALARDIDGYVYYKYITDADADKNGYLKQAEATAYLDLLKNVTKSQKYFMWMAGTGAKTDKNNPYK